MKDGLKLTNAYIHPTAIQGNGEVKIRPLPIQPAIAVLQRALLLNQQM